MSTKIEKLTPDQEAKLAVYRDMYIAYGLQTYTADHDYGKLSRLFSDVYQAGGLAAPAEIELFDSPRAANKRACELLGKEKEERLWACYGTLDAGWLSFYAYMYEVLELKTEANLRPLIELCKQGVGWSIPLTDIVVTSRLPEYIKFNPAKQLHCETGPAIRYRDDFRVYALRGRRITGDQTKFIDTPAGELVIKDVLQIEDVDVRASVMAKLGIEKLLGHLKSRKLDEGSVQVKRTRDGVDARELQNILNTGGRIPDIYQSVTEHYALYEVDLGDGFTGKVLRMQNPSVPGLEHVEGVGDDCDTISKALQFRRTQSIEGQFTPAVVLT